MKKILLFLNIILVGIIVFMVGKPNSNAQSTRQVQVFDTCMARLCRDTPTGHLTGMIDGLLLKQMSESYAKDAGKGYITTSSFGQRGKVKLQRDGLSVVFDLNKLRLLILQMQRNAYCNNHCDTSIKLGIRFYYIKYPSNTGVPGASPSLDTLSSDLRNKHSLVMVPAYKRKTDTEWHDYDLWGSRSGCFNSILFPGSGNPSFIPMGGVSGDLGDNHGGVSPPPYPGTFPTN
jgi:hypothetical protein